MDEAPPVSGGGAEPAKAPGRAGRDLPLAIGVGLGLGAVVIVTLYTVRAVFLGVVIVAIGLGIHEVVRALAVKGLRVPLVPVLVGGCATLVASYLRGSAGLTVAFLLTAVVTVAWRLLVGPAATSADAAATLWTLVWVPFLAGFAALLLMPPDGPRRVTAFVASVVCSDVGGYAAGVLVGRHPMAPTISPKKSWEGFGGSLVLCAIAGAVFLGPVLHGHWWQGLVFGVAVAAAATLGDLGESMVKRDIGIKDMGTLLPGHGGLMDRLDSLLLAAPVAWLLLTAFVPAPK